MIVSSYSGGLLRQALGVGLAGDLTAVAGHFAAGDKAGVLTGEEEDEAGNLVRLADTSEGDVAGIEGDAPGHGGIDLAGVHRVNPDPVRAQLQSGGLGQPANAPLGDDVSGHPRHSLQGSDGADVDD